MAGLTRQYRYFLSGIPAFEGIKLSNKGRGMRQRPSFIWHELTEKGSLWSTSIIICFTSAYCEIAIEFVEYLF